jgi:hypothetical protein
MKKLLYCDIDSTINNHRERIKRNTVGGWPGTEIDLKAFSYEEVMSDKVMPGAVAALKRLSQEYKIIFLSARDWDMPEGNTTKEWLEKKGFVYDELVIVRCLDDKIGYLKNNPGDLMIDDFSVLQETENLLIREDVIKRVKQYVKKVIVVDQNNPKSFWKETVDNLN